MARLHSTASGSASRLAGQCVNPTKLRGNKQPFESMVDLLGSTPLLCLNALRVAPCVARRHELKLQLEQQAPNFSSLRCRGHDLADEMNCVPILGVIGNLRPDRGASVSSAQHAHRVALRRADCAGGRSCSVENRPRCGGRSCSAENSPRSGGRRRWRWLCVPLAVSHAVTCGGGLRPGDCTAAAT